MNYIIGHVLFSNIITQCTITHIVTHPSLTLTRFSGQD